MNELGTQDPRFRNIDMRIIGSSATGVSSKTGKRILKPNDIDNVLINDELFRETIEKARALARERKLFPSYSIEKQLAIVSRSESQGIIQIVDSRLLPEVRKSMLSTNNIQQGVKTSISVARSDSSVTQQTYHSLTPNTLPRPAILPRPSTPVTPPEINPIKCDGNLNNKIPRNLLDSSKEYEEARKNFFKRMKILEVRATSTSNSRGSRPTLNDIRQSMERHNA
ncbi:MAG: hypothetical protein AABY07_05145, partial [Nanoarchaeota archaeon]